MDVLGKGYEIVRSGITTGYARGIPAVRPKIGVKVGSTALFSGFNVLERGTQSLKNKNVRKKRILEICLRFILTLLWVRFDLATLHRLTPAITFSMISRVPEMMRLNLPSFALSDG